MGPSSYTVIGDTAWFRASGRQDLVDGVHQVTAAILRAKPEGLGKLLVDVTGITGVDPPSVDMRFWLMGEFAKAGRGSIRMALVTRREFMSEDRFGIAFGMNQGFVSHLFETCEAALEWLSSHPAAHGDAAG